MRVQADRNIIQSNVLWSENPFALEFLSILPKYGCLNILNLSAGKSRSFKNKLTTRLGASVANERVDKFLEFRKDLEVPYSLNEGPIRADHLISEN